MINKQTRANSFNTGIAAEYYILSLLYRLGFEAYISQGNKKAIDIRIILQDGRSISLDVKSVRGYSSLVVNNVESRCNHFLAFVIYNNKFEDINAIPEVYIVPSIDLPSITKNFKKERRVMKTDLVKYLGLWETLKC
jgi:hypothetical protein